MDNFNNQDQQYNPYLNGQPQYNAYGSVPVQNNYNQGVQAQYNTYVNPTSQYGGVNSENTQTNKGKLFNLSCIMGLLGGVIILVGLMLPAIDFSHFHHDVDIQYNLFKVGKNVGIISGMWNVIPYVILIGAILLLVLSFVKIPILKILPILLILCMFILMLVDMGNVSKWATQLLDKFEIVLEKDITTGEIFKSLMPGIYIMVVGILLSITSCFVKIKEN
ncbi:MAG: hypothetical protein E7263_01580 [Lachnospiraceae bacterium]|nr:hypothetical protein [Lachnospiraceae bacterium]